MSGDIKNTHDAPLPELNRVLGKQMETGDVEAIASQENISFAPPEMAVIKNVFSIAEPKFKFNRAELTQMLELIRIKLNEEQAQTSEQVVKADQNKMEALHRRNVEKIQKSIEKAKKAKKSALAAKIFGWIATVLAVAAATIVAVVSFGSGSALVATAAIAGAALAVTITALSETGAMEKMTNGMAEGMVDGFKKMGLSDAKAKMAAKIMAQVIIAVIVMVTEIALAVMSGGAGAGEAVEKIADSIGKMTAKALKYATYAAEIGTQVANLGGAGAGTAAGVFEYQGGLARADVEDNKAFIAKMTALLEAERETIREVIKEITSTYGNIQDLMQNSNEASMRIAKQMSAV